MRALSILIGLLLSCPALAEQNPKDSTKDHGSRTIPLYMSSNRALVMLRVGDHAPVPVVFDSGTNGNLIDLKLADRLSLPNTGASPSVDGSTGKPVPGHDTFIKGARLGGVAIVDARATAFNYDLTDEVGIFGPNSFPDKLVRFDGPGSHLVVSDKTPNNLPQGKAVPYLGAAEDALPSAILDFGDLKVQAILDTGNDSTILLPMSYASRLSLAAPPTKKGYAISAAGKQAIFSSRLKGTVTIGSIKLDGPEILFMEGGRANIGLPVLRQLTVIFDPTDKIDWVL
jgi:predicted aspartyl protease